MANSTEHRESDRLRSYSSIFSRSVFCDMLSHSDFSQLDWLCSEYDASFTGGRSYMDYMRHIYRSLQRSYRCEYVFKNEIVNQLLLKQYGTRSTVAFNEFKVGDSIVDLAMFNGVSKAFEIKTPLDSPKRLLKQIADYRKVFNQCYLVVDEIDYEQYSSTVDQSVGIIIVSTHKGRLSLVMARQASISDAIDSEVAIKCLRTAEYQRIVTDYFGQLPAVPAFEMYDACKEMLANIPPQEFNLLFIQQLKQRRSATAQLKAAPKELRQMMLALNLPANKQDELVNILKNTPINSTKLCITRI